MPNPVDGSVWYTVGVFGGTPASCASIPQPGCRKSSTCRCPAYGIRGGDIDKNGVVWASLGSGHLGSFDRRKCKGPLNGPNATGEHCPEGWSFYQYPGPGFQGIGENSAESSYYTWVDQHNTFGLGENMPMSTANLNDGLVALKDGKMIVLRVPYPLGFYAKGFDGRIDDTERRLEGPRVVDHERRPDAVAAWKAAREACRASCTSSCGPIRWRIEPGWDARRLTRIEFIPASSGCGIFCVASVHEGSRCSGVLSRRTGGVVRSPCSGGRQTSGRAVAGPDATNMGVQSPDKARRWSAPGSERPAPLLPQPSSGKPLRGYCC